MKRIIKYKAIDGKIFESEEECVSYEFELSKPSSNSLILMNHDFDALPISIKGLEDAIYIKINNIDALTWVNRVSYEWGIYSPESVGSFYYDSNTNTWENAEQLLAKAKKIAEAFKVVL